MVSEGLTTVLDLAVECWVLIADLLLNHYE